MVGSTVDAAHPTAGWGGVVQIRKEAGLLFLLFFLPFFLPSVFSSSLSSLFFSFKNHLLSPLHDLCTLPELGDKMVSKILIFCLFRTFRQ